MSLSTSTIVRPFTTVTTVSNGITMTLTEASERRTTLTPSSSTPRPTASVSALTSSLATTTPTPSSSLESISVCPEATSISSTTIDGIPSSFTYCPVLETTTGITLPKRASITTLLFATMTTMIVLPSISLISTSLEVIQSQGNSATVFITLFPSSIGATSFQQLSTISTQVSSNVITSASSKKPTSQPSATSGNTTMATVTKNTTPSSSSTIVSVISALSLKHISLPWEILVPTAFGILALVASVFLWRKYARRSYDQVSFTLHAVFATIGGAIFGKKWDKWKATREENRHKEEDARNRFSSVDDEHARNWLMNRFNTAAQHPRHSSPPSNIPSGNSWRHVDREMRTSSSPQKPMEMTDFSGHLRDLNVDSGLNSNFTAEDQRNKGKGNEVSPATTTSSDALPRDITTGVPPTEIITSLPVAHGTQLSKESAWPEVPRPGIPWHPDFANFHSQWSSYEVPTPYILRDQIHQGVEAKRQDILKDIDTQSSASFRGARGVWPILHPQPLPSLPTIPPIAADVKWPTSSPTPLGLHMDHPILHVPHPETLPGETARNSDKLNGPEKTPTSQTRVSQSKYASLSGHRRNPPRPHDKNGIGTSPPIPSTTTQSLTLDQNPDPPDPRSSPLLANRYVFDYQTPTRPTSVAGSQWTDATVRDQSPSGLTARGIHAGVVSSGTGRLHAGPDPWGSLIGSHDRGSHAEHADFDREKRKRTSDASRCWEDDYGGRVSFDRRGRSKDMEFEDEADVRVGTERYLAMRRNSDEDVEKGGEGEDA